MSFIPPVDVPGGADFCAVPEPSDTARAARTWTGPGATERREILRRTRSIAMVGASANPARASFFVATYLLSSTPYDG